MHIATLFFSFGLSLSFFSSVSHSTQCVYVCNHLRCCCCLKHSRTFNSFQFSYLPERSLDFCCQKFTIFIHSTSSALASEQRFSISILISRTSHIFYYIGEATAHNNKKSSSPKLLPKSKVVRRNRREVKQITQTPIIIFRVQFVVLPRENCIIVNFIVKIDLL